MLVILKFSLKDGRFVFLLSVELEINFFSITNQVAENICKFAKKGLTPSQIGVILRDSHGIAQVKSVTGNKILRILKAHGEPSVPFLLEFFSFLYLGRIILWFLSVFSCIPQG